MAYLLDLRRFLLLLLVRARIFDVTERGELLHQLLRLLAIHLFAFGMHTALRPRSLPARHGFHFRHILKHLE